MTPAMTACSAGAKKKHAVDYTRYRGLTQASSRGKLKPAAMNPKRRPGGYERRDLPLSSCPCFGAHMRETRLMPHA